MVERMSDLIERQAAIERIKWWFGILKQNPDILIDGIKTLPSVQPDLTKLAQELWAKTCLITDNEGLQHQVIHTTDLKMVIEEVTGWMI